MFWHNKTLVEFDLVRHQISFAGSSFASPNITCPGKINLMLALIYLSQTDLLGFYIHLKQQGAHWPGKSGQPGTVRKFWKAPKGQWIVMEFHQKSGNFNLSQEFSAWGCYFVFVLIFCLLHQGHEDSRGNLSSEKSCYFDLDLSRNSPVKPRIVREFHSKMSGHPEEKQKMLVVYSDQTFSFLPCTACKSKATEQLSSLIEHKQSHRWLVKEFLEECDCKWINSGHPPGQCLTLFSWFYYFLCFVFSVVSSCSPGSLLWFCFQVYMSRDGEHTAIENIQFYQ